MSARITERSLYPAIYRILAEVGAKVVEEPMRTTLPDFVVSWFGELWLVSVKIGDIEEPRFIKGAFVQLFKELGDFREVLKGSDRAILLIYPESIKKIKPEEAEIERAVREEQVYAIVLRPQMEVRAPLPEVLKKVEEALRKKLPVSLSLRTVTSLLRVQIEELMNEVTRVIGLEEGLVKVVGNPQLFFGINPIEKDYRKRAEVLRKILSFLGAYIFLSQALFLRLYFEKVPAILEKIDPRNITKEVAKNLFEKVKEVNYRPIFDIEVLNYVPERLVQDTFRLLFALQIDNVRYELPGRLFHELMPKDVRKLLAAFYTRPVAAYLLAQLTIEDPNVTVFDPACGSGTILTMAYRRKLELWKGKEKPHRKFCEEHIFGCDIMPFAVHLTNANLVAMDPQTTIEYTQIVLGDSLQLAPEISVKPGFRSLMDFVAKNKEAEEELGIKVNAYSRTGELIEIRLKPVNVVLMNPPFTKVERGIKKFVDINTEKFEKVVGKEVGLWGHFVALADTFLKEEGVFGAVLPINLLRGRESKGVREIVFKRWLPLYVIKPSRNYGFSEYAEYRDILVIARKTRKRPEKHRVKFCIVKKDLNELTDEEVKHIAELIKSSDKLRSELLDVNSHSLEEVYKRFDNLMYFISGPSLSGLEALHRVIGEAERLFNFFPEGYFKEGYGPRPENSSSFMFITRPGEGRVEEAFLRLADETPEKIIATTPVGIERFTFSKRHFLPALRTPVGLKRMDVTGLHDYVAKEPYEGIEKVMSLAGFKEVRRIDREYWERYVKTEFERATTYLAVVRRVNLYSPAQFLLAFNSRQPLIVSTLFNVITEKSEDMRKAVVVLLNSIFSLAYIFAGKEETTGRYIDVRQHDLYGMKLFPSKEQAKKLAEVYEKYKDAEFPSLREQLDRYFDERYNTFWAQERRKTVPLVPPPPIEVHPLRLSFDLEVVRSIGSNLTKEDLLKAYGAIVWDMIITRGLRRD